MPSSLLARRLVAWLHCLPTTRRTPSLPRCRRNCRCRRSGSSPGLWSRRAALAAGALPGRRAGADRQRHPVRGHLSGRGRCRILLGSLLAAWRLPSRRIAPAPHEPPPPGPQHVHGRHAGGWPGRRGRGSSRAAAARRLCTPPLQDVQVRGRGARSRGVLVGAVLLSMRQRNLIKRAALLHLPTASCLPSTARPASSSALPPLAPLQPRPVWADR